MGGGREELDSGEAKAQPGEGLASSGFCAAGDQGKLCTVHVGKYLGTLQITGRVYCVPAARLVPGAGIDRPDRALSHPPVL